MNHDSAKQVHITHPIGLGLPFGPSFGYRAIPPSIQTLQKGKFPSFLLENHLQPNIAYRKENFVNIPTFPKLNKEDSQSIPSTASWAEGEETHLPDSYQVAKAVEKAELMKIKSPKNLEEFCPNKLRDFKCKKLFSLKFHLYFFLFELLNAYMSRIWEGLIIYELLFRAYFILQGVFTQR